MAGSVMSAVANNGVCVSVAGNMAEAVIMYNRFNNGGVMA
jgi:hypothetical protein